MRSESSAALSLPRSPPPRIALPRHDLLFLFCSANRTRKPLLYPTDHDPSSPDDMLLRMDPGNGCFPSMCTDYGRMDNNLPVL